MIEKPTYEELEHRIMTLERETSARENRLLRLISNVSKLILLHESAEKWMHDLPAMLADYFNVPIVVIELYDVEQKEMVFAGTYGLASQSLGPLHIPVDKTISGTVVRMNKAFASLDVRNHTDYSAGPLRDLNVMTFTCTPIATTMNVIGALSVADRKVNPKIVESADLIQAIATFIAQELNRNEAERQKRASEDRYRRLVENMTQGVVIQDVQGRIIEANHAACRILGLSMDQMLDRTSFDPRWRPIQEDGSPCDPTDFPSEVALRTGRPVENAIFGIYAPEKDEYRWLLIGSVPQFDQGEGMPVATMTFFTDVTERKRFQENLLENSAKLERALDSMTDGVFIANRSGELVDMNKAWVTFSRFQTKDECLKKLSDYPDLFEVYFPDGTPTPLEFWALSRALRGETQTNIEYTIRRKDTGESWVGSYSFSPIRNDQEVITGAVVVARDITDLKKQESVKRHLKERLSQAEKMESIGILAGGIAHDFNNILAAIIGYTELAMDEVEKDTSLEEYLQEVYTAGNRAKDLVNQILTFARRSGEERRPIHPGKITKDVLKMIRSSIPTTIEIKSAIESESQVIGNPTQIHQIFMNLCTNAYQAMEDEGGTLTVTVRDVPIEFTIDMDKGDYNKDECLEIRVADTGGGIAPDIIDSIFEPYFTTKGVGEGTGMGLAVVHGIVESYGGKINVESMPGSGTCFTIHLPITNKKIERQEYQRQELPRGTERILIVDDEPAIVKVAGQLLTGIGYSVMMCTSSLEALALFKKRPYDFDLVITDMTMPDMTGDQLAKAMMQIRHDIPVILLTGYSKKITDQSASEIGIKAFAFKPITWTDLANTIRKVLDMNKSGE